MRCIIVPGIFLGCLYSLFGLACFAVAKQYERDTCGVEDFHLQEWVFASSFIYYFAGLFFLFFSTFIDYEKPPRYTFCVWVISLSTNICFTFAWSITGGMNLLMDSTPNGCQNIAYLLWITAILTISIVSTFGIGLSGFLLVRIINYRDN
jgi:hypothetical protein